MKLVQCNMTTQWNQLRSFELFVYSILDSPESLLFV